MTGGSGFVGQHLVRRLLADGHSVRALARSTESAAVVEGLGATAVLADLLEAPSFADELRDVEVVVHAAAHTGVWGDRRVFERVNVVGTRSLLAAARRAGVRRFVHVSTEAVLAAGRPLHLVDEQVPYPRRHAGEYARTKAVAEQLVLAADDAELDTVAVRPRLVWGPGDATVLPQVLAAVRAGRWVWVDHGRYLTSTCHVRNVCEGIVLAAEHGRGGRAYFLTDGPPVELRAFLTRAALAHGVALPDRSVPHLVARAVATLDPAWRVLHLPGAPPLPRTALALMGHEMTVDDTRARAELGYGPVVTVDEGLAELAGAGPS